MSDYWFGFFHGAWVAVVVVWVSYDIAFRIDKARQKE